MIEKKLAKNAVYNVIKSVMGVIFPLITFPYVSRKLGVESLGEYNFSSSFLSYFLLISSFGIPTYGIREGTQLRNNKSKIRDFISNVFSINIYTSLLSYLAMAIIIATFPLLKQHITSIAILSLEIIFTTIGVSWVCNIYEDFFAISIRTIIMQLLSFLLIIVFVHKPSDLYKYLITLVVSNSGANIFNYFYIRKKYCDFKFYVFPSWKPYIKPLLIIFSTTVAITAYASSDITMLGIMTNNYYVGLYGTAVKIYTVIKNVFAAILMVMIPRFSLLLKENNKERINQFFSEMFNLLTLIMIPICTGIFMLSDEIIKIVSGPEFIEASNSLKILCPAIVFSLYSYLYTQCILIPSKKESGAFVATLVSAIVNIVLNYIFIPMYGIKAAATTTIIAELTTFLLSWAFAKGQVYLVNFRKNMLEGIMGCFGVILSCLLSKKLFGERGMIVPSIFFSVLIYIFVLLVSKNQIVNEIFAYFNLGMAFKNSMKSRKPKEDI